MMVLYMTNDNQLILKDSTIVLISNINLNIYTVSVTGEDVNKHM